MLIGTIELPRVLTSKGSWQRDALSQYYEHPLPNVRLSEYDRNRNETGFRIDADDRAIGFMWIQNFHASRYHRPHVTLSVLSTSTDLPVPETDPIFSEYHGRGYGMAAYLIGIEHLADQNRALRSGGKMTTHSIALWQRLVRCGVAVCRSEPVPLPRQKI